MTDEPPPGAPAIRLRLLGWWELRAGARQVFLGHREQRLITLLALRGHRSRLDVAGTLWPDTTEARALASLRAAVSVTRRMVSGLCWTPDRTSIGLDPSVRVDVREVLEDAHRVLALRDVDQVDTLRTLSQGDLLPGWYEDWLLCERERLEQARLAALESLARDALARGRPDIAASAARMAVMIEPLREAPRVLLVRALVAAGERGSALGEYRSYCRRLSDELGIEPSAQLQELIGSTLGRGVRARAPVARVTETS